MRNCYLQTSNKPSTYEIKFNYTERCDAKENSENFTL